MWLLLRLLAKKNFKNRKLHRTASLKIETNATTTIINDDDDDDECYCIYGSLSYCYYIPTVKRSSSKVHPIVVCSCEIEWAWYDFVWFLIDVHVNCELTYFLRPCNANFTTRYREEFCSNPLKYYSQNRGWRRSPPFKIMMERYCTHSIQQNKSK